MADGGLDRAWEELEEAIERFLQATGEPGLLMDWVLVAHKLQAGVDGEDSYTTSWTGAQRQPLYRALGLATFARADIERQLVNIKE